MVTDSVVHREHVHTSGYLQLFWLREESSWKSWRLLAFLIHTSWPVAYFLLSLELALFPQSSAQQAISSQPLIRPEWGLLT